MNATQKEQITNHGLNLLRIYPDSLYNHGGPGDKARPVELCKRLHRIETMLGNLHVQLCNADATADYDEVERIHDRAIKRVKKLLGDNGPDVQINSDPRGYALKIDDKTMRDGNIVLYRDMGGYGIICPEF